MSKLSPASAAEYIRAKHAAHGGATITGTREYSEDGISIIEVLFIYMGHEDRADVWICEFTGQLYGEW